MLGRLKILTRARCRARLASHTPTASSSIHCQWYASEAAPDDSAAPAAGVQGLTEDQIAYRELATNFAADKLLPFAAHWDETKEFSVDTLRQAAQLGFGAVYVKEDVGGTGLGRADAAVIFEALAYGDISLTAYLTIHNMVCIGPQSDD
jgi:alkylation response protein AidB-like acyl-CoA dehydrogenase